MRLTSLTYEILLALADAPRHGYGIIKEIEARFGVPSAPSTGALYLALQRMEAEGLIEEAREKTAVSQDRRRRYWSITRRGREAAETESERLAARVAVARTKDLLAADRS
jgi:PadR family transcriptional regulator, regulatory protein PadR